MSAHARKELVLSLDTAHLAEVRRAVLDLLAAGCFPPDDIQLLALAVDEAVANVMEHAYCGVAFQASHQVKVVMHLDTERFEVLILDRGREFDPNTVPELDIRRHVQNGRKGGLGVFLIRRIMDEVNYTYREDEHNELRLIKYVDKRIAKARSKPTRRTEGVQKRCP